MPATLYVNMAPMEPKWLAVEGFDPKSLSSVVQNLTIYAIIAHEVYEKRNTKSNLLGEVNTKSAIDFIALT